MTKKQLCSYVLIMVLVFTLSLSSVNASDYINYFGVSMTSQQYNTLLELGFTEDEIYYMGEEHFEVNKNLSAELLSQSSRYYKTIYTGLGGEEYTTEISESEYNNQSHMDARGTVTTNYKNVITTISRNGTKLRYKITVGWNSLPSTRSYDIIGIGFDDDVYINSPLYYSTHYCITSSSDCVEDTIYYDQKILSTGGAKVFKLPATSVGARSLSSVLYYDVSKNTSDTLTEVIMYGDYSHATSAVNYSLYTDYTVNRNGIVLGDGLGHYDAIPYAAERWTGTW